MKIRQTKYGNMCEARLENRRIRVYRLHDQNWAVEFVRPYKPCAGFTEAYPAEQNGVEVRS